MQAKSITAAYIPTLEKLSDEELRAALLQTESHAIECVNWHQEYPYAPDVKFHIAHDRKSIAVLFEVEEEHIRAVTLEDNGPVWEDSCVEFFVRSPRGDGYFNFERNCAGALLAAFRRSRNDAHSFTPEELAQIRRFGSLPHALVDNLEGGKWWVVEVIPFSLLGFDEMPESIDANLYKCGDRCRTPHFLSWSPIELPEPNFHCPEFFGTIRLETAE